MASEIERPPTAFQGSGPGQQRRPTVKAGAHLAYLRRLLCLACGSRRRLEAAHLRYADARYSKLDTGRGRKPDDKWAVPLCADCHREGPEAQHNSNERAWWEKIGIDPLLVALLLWGATGDEAAGEQIIAEHRRRRK